MGTWSDVTLRATYGLEERVGSGDQGADLVLDRPDGLIILVNIELQTPQTAARLEALVAEAETLRAEYPQARDDQEPPSLLLVFPGVLARARRRRLEVEHQRLDVWDGEVLRARATEVGIPLPPFVEQLTRVNAIDDPYEIRFGRRGLSERLTAIEAGTTQWRAYEDFCEDLLNYLFVPPLNAAITQSRDEHNVNRRDFILPNYATEGFWCFVRDHYDADYVVAEAKNLSHPPGKNEILQTANYLSSRGTGLFALLLSRNPMDDTANWICREQWSQHGKMIIGMDDGDVLQMIATKRAGGEPADMVRQKLEDFRLRM